EPGPIASAGSESEPEPGTSTEPKSKSESESDQRPPERTDPGAAGRSPGVDCSAVSGLGATSPEASSSHPIPVNSGKFTTRRAFPPPLLWHVWRLPAAGLQNIWPLAARTRAASGHRVHFRAIDQSVMRSLISSELPRSSGAYIASARAGNALNF